MEHIKSPGSINYCLIIEHDRMINYYFLNRKVIQFFNQQYNFRGFCKKNPNKRYFSHIAIQLKIVFIFGEFLKLKTLT